MRTYESNLAVLTITGSAGSDQAVAAAAADGGATAEEHLSSGAEAMVIETQFPGGTADGNSTVSTKLVSASNFFLFFFRKLKLTRNASYLQIHLMSYTFTNN